jgi:peptidoglycan/xylan/chitin deacetylase (PgdA/CDA1 family)
MYPSAVWRKDASVKKLYLTFDDGPVPDITPWVLDVLKQYKIKATFFCVGDNIQKHPDIYNRILTEKHRTGNHTFHHLNGWNTDTNKYLDNISKCAEVVNSNLFRPPYGKLKQTQLKRIGKDYSIVMWDVLSGDYDKNTNPEKCLNNVVQAARNGSVIVFHDSVKSFKNLEYTLPRFIEYAQRQGFEFEAL